MKWDFLKQKIGEVDITKRKPNAPAVRRATHRLTLLLMLVISLSLGYFLFMKNAQANLAISRAKTADSSAEMHQMILEDIEKELNSTAAGAELLRQAKKKAEDQNAELSKRATSAESQLATKKSELAQTNADLTAKQAEIDRAERGVGLFYQAESLFRDYNASASMVNTYLSAVYLSIIQNNAEDVNRYANLLQSEQATMDSLYDQITNLFNKIQSGDY